MKSILEKIVDYKKLEVENSKKQSPIKNIEKKIIEIDPAIDFKEKLQEKNNIGKAGIIAEIKKASPSKGVIRKNFNHIEIAKEYVKGGAACLSILTDTPSFQGSPEYLKDIKKFVKLPILRKDFMIDTYQVFESRSWGSDCILIIMRILSDLEIDKLVNTARDLKMSILFEVHSKEEVMRALKFNPNLIGINNRNLENFKTDINNSIEIKKIIPDDVLIISESGIKSPEDISFLRKENINNFLIGESLMKSNKISEDLNLLVNKGE